MDWRVRLPGALYRQCVERAGSDADLAALVRLWLTRYLDPPQAAGGQARAARLTPERRADIARSAARARHRRPAPD